ncbi:RND transporter family protein [Periweissella fabalis]|uniref:Uncharacterized protein n=1 Tax=Periweissella fabalis TaxID=1070421 RepID=A0A7X6N3F8_9LACO|nr:hypothetical protein [Periweissella fabalis]MCM0599619.1 hypothetical protein [Periweissella fabalis]NKZ23924.1 hypothetical protein [Periweissella fabalis]
MIHKIFKQCANKLMHYPKSIIAIVAIITIILGLGLPNIQIKMGNDVFVNPHSTVYKNTEKAQKAFGGDNAYVLFSAKDTDIINHSTFAKIAEVEKSIQSNDHVIRTTSVISLLNQQLKSTGVEKLMGDQQLSTKRQQSLQVDIMANLNTKAKSAIQQATLTSLSDTQKQQIQTYILSILTDQQKLALAKNNATTNLNSILTNDQQDKVNQYTQSILTVSQQRNLAKLMLQNLPSVEKCLQLFFVI